MVCLYLDHHSPTRAFICAFIWQCTAPWFPSLRISQLFPFGVSPALHQLIWSRDPGLPPHWSPRPTGNLIGWTILSRPWVRSFGVGCSAVRRPNYLPDSLEDFLRPTQTFKQQFQAPGTDKDVSQWSSFVVVNIWIHERCIFWLDGVYTRSERYQRVSRFSSFFIL